MSSSTQPKYDSNYGFATETMFQKVMEFAQWKRVTLPKKETLLTEMSQMNKRRFDLCLKPLLTKLRSMTAQDVMDTFYKVDYLIEVETLEGWKKIAIDITTNPNSVKEKADKLIELKKPIHKVLGADHVLIVVWTGPAFKAMVSERQWQVFGRISDRIEELASKHKWCAITHIK